MKKISFLFVFSIIIISACKQQNKQSENTQDSATVAEVPKNSEKWIIDTKTSSVAWKGTKPTGFHEGIINIKEGNLSTEDNLITSGNFILDMTSIAETTHSDDQKSQNKLVNHLKSDDFFSVDSFPTAKFEITKVNGNIIFGNLTIKNITREVNFPANVKINGATLTANAKFDIERTDWNVNYNSGKKFKDIIAEKMIGEKIGYTVSLIAYKD